MAKHTSIEVSDLRDHIGFWMRLVSNDVSYAFARKLETSEITVAEWVVLRETYSGDKIMSPSKIAEMTGLTRGAISKLIERLLQKGLLTRSEAAGDRRYQEIELTSKAIKLVPKLANLADQNDQEFFSTLTSKERDSLKTILKKLVEQNKLTTLPIK